MTYMTQIYERSLATCVQNRQNGVLIRQVGSFETKNSYPL